MPLETYKLIHLIGLILLFTGLGANLIGGGDSRAPKLVAVLHGLGLLTMLVGGFGMMARYAIEFPWPGWLFAKLAIWLVIGALPMFVKRKAIPKGVAWILAASLGGVAAWLAIAKPF